MIRKMLHSVPVCLCLTIPLAGAQEIEMNSKTNFQIKTHLHQYESCKSRHIANVAKTVASLQEGVMLLQEVLCSNGFKNALYLMAKQNEAHFHPDDKLQSEIHTRRYLTNLDYGQLYNQKLKLTQTSKQFEETGHKPVSSFPLKFFW